METLETMELERDERLFALKSGYFLWKGRSGRFTSWNGEEPWTTPSLGMPVEIQEIPSPEGPLWLVFLLDSSVTLLDSTGVLGTLVLDGRPVQAAKIEDNVFLLNLDTGITGTFTFNPASETPMEFTAWENSRSFESAGLLNDGRLWMLEGGTLTVADRETGTPEGIIRLPWTMTGLEEKKDGSLVLQSEEQLVRLKTIPGE